EIASPKLADEGFSILSGVAIDALAARATERCKSRSALRWFEPVARTPGFFRALASTLVEIRINDIDLERLAAGGPAGGDLAELAREFETALNETRVADLSSIYQTASSAPSRYRDMPLLLMDLMPVSLLEQRFVESLVNGNVSVLATAHQRNDRAL